MTYGLYHSPAAVWGSVGFACGMFAFLAGTWRMAQQPTWVSAGPSHD